MVRFSLTYDEICRKLIDCGRMNERPQIIKLTFHDAGKTSKKTKRDAKYPEFNVVCGFSSFILKPQNGIVLCQ